MEFNGFKLTKNNDATRLLKNIQSFIKIVSCMVETMTEYFLFAFEHEFIIWTFSNNNCNRLLTY